MKKNVRNIFGLINQSIYPVKKFLSKLEFHLSVTIAFVICSLCIFSCTRTANVYIYKHAEATSEFPEAYLDLPSVGICFSGGGSHAMAAAIGQMKGISVLELWDDIGYMSAVSGGSWAATIFTYYNKGAKNDHQLLGDTIAPDQLTMEKLKYLPEGFMIKAVTKDLTLNLLKLLAENEISFSLLEKSDFIWIDAIGLTFLEQYGLYDRENPKYYTLNKETRKSILNRNPHLKAQDFNLVHEGDSNRPFLVINSSVVAPASDLPLSPPEKLSVFNYTPLYIGSNVANRIVDTTIFDPHLVDFQVGGGFIEPFGFGSESPQISKLPEGGNGPYEVTINLPKDRFGIVDATGTSSSAFGAIASSSLLLQIPTELFLGFTADQLLPEEEYWPFSKDGGIIPSRKFRYSDGGNLENYGLISLLQRGVQNIVVFINTDVPLEIVQDTCNLIPSTNNIDGDLLPLFGYPYVDEINNQVFKKSDFDTVYRGLVDAKLANQTVMTKTELTTVANDLWGIDSGQVVNILWVYNDQVPEWECQLPDSVQYEINLGNKGLFADFPNYKLIGETTFPKLINLSTQQANLLFQLSAWNVYSNHKIFKKFIRRKN